ncbi:MAG: M20/M25/M40 family metallo-hydrolase [Reichenbachiella sp.]|uniref:M20/M25/M40 family metallo-hydrolase n=1 Tax=Reichenbachiella sp. TaxID=2184521 RepID=UPI0032671C1D
MIKKVLIALGVMIVFLILTIFYIPEILYATAFGQRLLMKMEGDQVARFYYRENQVGKDTIYMEGVIYSNTLNEIYEVLENNPELTTLVMKDVPGSIDDEVNLKASFEIRRHNINTYIPKDGMVASGGTDMFLAGRERAVHPTARLGVHSWAGMDSVAIDYPKDHIEHKKYLDYYAAMEIPSEFYWYTLVAAPSDDIHWMSPAEIEKYKVVTDTDASQEILKILEKLASDEFRGRSTGDNKEAQDFIRTYFEDSGLKKFDSQYDVPFTYKRMLKERNGTNVVGYINGKTHIDKYIVIGAHYDHLGIKRGEVYNGADDNASGTAALLYLARHFSQNQPEHSIIFAAFDAEEVGLHGSKAFIKNPPVSLSKIRLNVNFDMISRSDKNEIYVVGTFPFPQFKPQIEEHADASQLNVSYGHDDPNDKTKEYWMYSSDNGPFFRKAIPTITFSEEDHPDYHQSTDDFEKINPEFYLNVVDLIRETIESIDQNFPSSEQ